MAATTNLCVGDYHEGTFRPAKVPNYTQKAGKTIHIEVEPLQYVRKGNGPHMLNIGGHYPNQFLSLVIWEKSLKERFPKNFHPRHLKNKNFRISGKVSLYKGYPQVVIYDPKQIEGVPLLANKIDAIETNGTFELLINSPLGVNVSNTTKSPIGKALINLINSTQKTLDLAIYGFRNQPQIYEAICKAKERGVLIRLITDRSVDGGNYYTCTEDFEKLVGLAKNDLQVDIKTNQNKGNGSPVSFWPRPIGFLGYPQPVGYSIDEDLAIIAVHASKEEYPDNSDIMHNKFVISDRFRVWTGSCNLSDTGTGGYNANVACLIKSTKVAKHYTEEFDRMYVDGLFHRLKKPQYTNIRVVQLKDNKKLNLGFCPQDNVVHNSLLPALEGAQKNIDIAMFYLTHKIITAELINAHLRGVSIRIIIDGTSASNGYTKHKILRDVGIPVKVENWGGKMHMKAACIDGHQLVLGSMNWTNAGNWDNDENYIFLESNIDGMLFTRAFNMLWESIPEKCLVDDPDPESLASPGSTTDGIDNDFNGLIDADDPKSSKEIYNSKKTPPHGFATKSNGYGTINGKKYALIMGVSDNGHHYHLNPKDPKYFKFKNQNSVYFPSKWEAEEAGYRNMERTKK